MSGVESWDENERALYALGSRQLLDSLDRQIEEWRESWALDTTSTDEMTREHNARMRQLEEDHKAWLARFLSGDDQAAPKYVAAGGHEDAASVLKDASAGHNGLQQRPNLDPRAAELADRQRAQEMAAAVHDMDLGEYAQLRAELNIGHASARGLFG